jgi:hypothetical protein
MAQAEHPVTQDNATEQATPHDNERHRQLYQGMMDFGFQVGLPVGGAIALFVALLLLDANVIVSFFLSFFAWLGLYGFAKTFFKHEGH